MRSISIITRERKHIPQFRTRIFVVRRREKAAGICSYISRVFRVVWRQKDRYKLEYVFVHEYNSTLRSSKFKL